jgi:type II secretory pathway pseudopilin PulG
MKRYQKRHEKGFGLLETAVSLVVIGSLVASVLLMASNHHADQSRQQVVEDVQAINRVIQRAYSGVAKYPIFDDALEEDLFFLMPTRIVDEDSSMLRSPLGGYYKFGTENSCPSCRDKLFIRVADLGMNDCKALLPMDYGKGALEVGVSTGGGGGGPITRYSTPLDPGQAITACEAKGGNNLNLFVWYKK